MHLNIFIIICNVAILFNMLANCDSSFDFALYREISNEIMNENIVLSPFTIQVLLGYIYVRSAGKLAYQLQNILQLPWNRTRNSWNFENIFNALNNNRDGVTLLMANGIFYNENYGRISMDAEHLARESFRSEVKSLDFSNNEMARNYINDWIAERTQQFIKNIFINRNPFDDRTNAILLNAIYYRGIWDMPFSRDDTEKYIFHKLNGQQAVIDMMSMDNRFLHYYDDNLKSNILELPYKSSDFNMLIILPIERYGLNALKYRFDLLAENLQKIRINLKPIEVQLKLPKFQFEFNFNIMKSLQNLGLTSLFNEESEIYLFDKQEKRLIVDGFHHKAFIRVNEAGTEAAAATFIKLTALSLPVNMTHFVADHPFIFIIHNTKTVFFMGHLVNP